MPDRPLRRDAERNRQRILAAAREVFAARGVDVTLDDIAHHAGLGVGTVYRRYPSRELLVEALFAERLERMVALAAAARGNPDPWAGLVCFAEASAEDMAADRGLRDVVFSRVYGHEHVEQARVRLEPEIDDLVARAHAAGVLRPGVEGGDLVMLQFMIAAVLEYSEHVAPGLWRRYLAVALDGLRSGCGPLPGASPDVEILNRVAQEWRPPRRPA
ncbi:TetR/AcrR family transcriptional regulator [Cryptosporangium arvum]|uniref:TetR/AcrR family transcriptional regulator n=1 Tax=Cryptosporangium arvum TaxID=80871 RepID=UPI0004BAFC9C|nr:TetR/AcrR family transcriptional regulator [Cryptosporangium arvum]